MIARTTIPINEITNDDIHKIFDLYRSLDVPIKDSLENEIPADMITCALKAGMSRQFEITPQPFTAPDNKLIFHNTYNSQDNNAYVGLQIILNDEKIKDSSKLMDTFYTNIKKIFLVEKY
jgi:hypothetical protein